MALSALLVAEVTRQRLGDDGLLDLAACPWPVDSQSCGRFLGDDPPVLFVDDLAGQAIASLHHQRCRPPAWNDSMTVIAGSGQYTTFKRQPNRQRIREHFITWSLLSESNRRPAHCAETGHPRRRGLQPSRAPGNLAATSGQLPLLQLNPDLRAPGRLGLWSRFCRLAS
jgi:hypothetical protein